MAALTRFWTSTAAMSGSRPMSKVAVIELKPSLPLVEERYFSPSAPLICCSSGVVTADSTTWALAPMYTLWTPTCGGARLGNCATGSLGMEIAPARMIINAHTVAKMGRRMKNELKSLPGPGDSRARRRAGTGSLRRSCDLRA